MSTPVYLSGFSFALPPRKVTNEDLSKLMETSDEWITQRSGIKERYWVEAPMSTSALGTESARNTLAKVPASDVGAIIAATLSPDYSFPGIGVQIQSQLGLPPVPAYDIRNQCSGFLYGVEMGGALIQSGIYSSLLVIGAEVHSTGLDLSTRGRDIAVLFGDGAGSCLIRKIPEAPTGTLVLELLGSELHSDGAYVEELWCEHPGSAHFPTRVTRELVEEGKCFPRMNGKKVFEHAVKRMAEVSTSILAKLDLKPGDVRMLVPHQANLRINQMVAHQLGLSEDRCFNTIREYGNTTAATIPIGLARLEEARVLQRGDIVLSAAFGSGFTWGAVAFRVHSV